jgi:hypothetical protein
MGLAEAVGSCQFLTAFHDLHLPLPTLRKRKQGRLDAIAGAFRTYMDMAVGRQREV